MKRVVLLAAIIVSGCGGGERKKNFPPPLAIPVSKKEQLCPTPKVQNGLPEIKYEGTPGEGTLRFEDIRDSVNSACMTCHKVPARTGHFSYTGEYAGAEVSVGGVTKYYPGIAEVAEKMADALLDPNEEYRMPPENRRKLNPEAFLRIGKNLRTWIAAGKPQGSFGDTPTTHPQKILTPTTDLGDCTPKPEIIGWDYQKDRFFAEAKQLPSTLFETDLFSLDAFVLAQKGTLAYNVEYPLWADGAEKGRWVHIPAKVESNVLTRQAITLDPRTKQFNIPENTRFYKSFYRQIKMANGKSRLRRVETRLIVVRKPWDQSLFGTYRWDETEQSARLVVTPYRDGSSFKDTIFPMVVDEKSGKERPYAIPAKHRCLECHRGAEGDGPILGFTPLQINRRQGREDDLTQANRLRSYGIVAGYEDGEELPRLEWIRGHQGSGSPRNIYELAAQGYMVGNCAHCHNPKGFAFTPENGVNFDLRAGELFDFNTTQRSTQRPTRALVHSGGDLDSSQVWSKVADSPSQQGITSRMPMHTPGSPDCKVLRVVGKWLRSFESIQAAREWEPECKKSEDIDWVDQDFTWPKSDHYIPRRADWKDPAAGMPERYRQLVLSDSLKAISSKDYPVGYWNKKPQCRFPTAVLPPEQQRPWMLKEDGSAKRPFGEVYRTTPGSWYFRTTCFKCHGERADGNTGLARGLLNWSGGSVRVANLIDGLFGNAGKNQKEFEVKDQNLAGNYLIWMAMEGTRVQFPPEASNFIGKHGAQMLNQVREKCLRQISIEKASSPKIPDHEIFREVCFSGNKSPDDPSLQFDPVTTQPRNPAAVEEWLDQAAFNGGWMIFQYLQEASHGTWRLGNSECEKIPGGQP